MISRLRRGVKPAATAAARRAASVRYRDQPRCTRNGTG